MGIDKKFNFNTVSIVIDKDLIYPIDPFNEEDPMVLKIKRRYDEVLYALKLDQENYGTKAWNPFSEFINKEEFVVVKPNLVRHIHLEQGDIRSVIVNPIIIKLTLDYVFKALQGSGKVVLGDAPLQSADFDKIYEINQFEKFKEYYHQKGYKLIIKDFRREASVKEVEKLHHHYGRREINPRGNFIEVNLKDQSYFYNIRKKYKRFRVTQYNYKFMRKAHNLVDNKYLIHKDVLDADVIIGIPKLKTHRKAGITCAMKNFIGINGHKDYLPHHTFGAKEKGGDEYLYYNIFRELQTYVREKGELLSYLKMNKHIITKLQDLNYYLVKLLGKVARSLGKYDQFREGSWYGNDTLWRTIADLNIIIYFSDKSGNLQENIQRKIFNIVDGIIAGDKESPMEPRSRPIGLIAGSFSTFNLDYVLAGLIGFDWEKIPSLKKVSQFDFSSSFMKRIILGETKDLKITLNGKSLSYKEMLDNYNLHFIPTKGWVDHIELS